MSNDESQKREKLVPPDLSGRDPEEILRGFMQVEPERVEERLRRDRGEGSVDQDDDGGSES